MRWLITGAGGQLAVHAEALLRQSGDEVVALSEVELDITSGADVERAIADLAPDVVLNAAAYTAVDAAESNEALAARVNGDGPGLLAAALAGRSGRLIHVSTDYVFAGDAQRPYEVNDDVAPVSAYGRTKLAGERAVRASLPDRSHVVRTAWVYGGPSPNFVDTMIRLEGERETLDVVADQIGCPTWAGDLAAGLIALARADVAPGVLHFVNSGQASWCDLAQETFRLIGADPARVRPIDSDAYPSPTKRPAWSVLSTAAWDAAGLPPARPWRDALADAISRR